jgi:hypothetical protein
MNIVAVLTMVVKEQQAQIDQLNKRVDELMQKETATLTAY